MSAATTPAGPSTPSIAGVVGGGFMGMGIAESAARARIDVVVYEPDAPGRERARSAFERSVARGVEAGKLEAAEGDELLARVEITGDLDAVGTCGLVVEAVPEDEQLKREVFADLARLAPP